MRSLPQSCFFLTLPAMVFAVVLCAVGPVAAQSGSTFYVAKSGSDDNSGSMSAPWLTIQHAANTVTAGATVYVESGVYHESVNFPNAGTVAQPITFTNYPGQAPVIDGTGVACCSSSGKYRAIQGLITIENVDYLTVSGFEIRNYTTNNVNLAPAGIWITGYGKGIQILNNGVHNITTQVEKTGNAYGIAAYGTSAAPITNLTISGNEVYDLKTGQSESVNVDGNVTHFSITNNLVHDNDNIGIDAIGYEGVGPAGHDRARYGEVSGNTVYKISGRNNPGEGDSYDADGLYCDGCEYVVFERNTISECDIGVEAASEHGLDLSSYVTIRNNVIFDNYTVGITIGGYGRNTGKKGSDRGGGTSANVVIVNNTLYNNNTKNGGGEYQIQYRANDTNLFENNIVYAGKQNVWIYGFTKTSTPIQDWNLYYSAAGYVKGTSIFYAGVSKYADFAAYQSASGQDADSAVRDPLFVDAGSNFDLQKGSPAINSGNTDLSCAVGYCGNSNSIYGATNYEGTPRINGSGQINIGAW